MYTIIFCLFLPVAINSILEELFGVDYTSLKRTPEDMRNREELARGCKAWHEGQLATLQALKDLEVQLQELEAKEKERKSDD